MSAELGIVITNRDRPQPLRNCLISIAVQPLQPEWVVIADLGSSPQNAEELEGIANEFAISYLRIGHFGPWNISLAFNTALRAMPPASHIVQLDADMILHPFLLPITRRVLEQRDAFSCVASYVSADGIPDPYDGSCRAFRLVLSHARAGHEKAIGGYMVLPREWLLRSRGFDETLMGWGFQDGDLWCRAEREMTTCSESTGSLIVHQDHPRQFGASLAQGPNWDRFQKRIADPSLPVNPESFGDATVDRTVTRHGILPIAMNLPPEHAIGRWADDIRARQMQQGRLAPCIEIPCSVTAARKGPIREEARAAAPFLLSVVIPLHNDAAYRMRLTIISLLAQSVPPIEIILSDEGSAHELSLGYQTVSKEFSNVRYLRCEDFEGSSRARAINSALRVCAQNTTVVLIVESGLCFLPGATDFLCSKQADGPCFVHGHSHSVPPLVDELDLLDSIPWPAWGASAYLEQSDPDLWHFAPRCLLLRAGLYDERKPGWDAIPEAVNRAARDPRVVRVSQDCVLALKVFGELYARG